MTAVTRGRKAPAALLAPVDKTRMLPTRGGGVQCWGAKTKDGTWSMAREDEAGTPWSVTHLPTGIVVDRYVGTLTDCRAYVASGQARADLARIQAHQRGEHKTDRDKSCPKC
jgi:hypothetical protein